ncbi:MAG TPA: FGGY-family carbohydrate kinase [Chitinophagales bacterium]|jgi:xylulokinase|nr:FGGY-family carbohydrate kinase [Chitinophagales bacterium]HQW77852.1 FGGY-family carbohydrate kinase [Chitinophagales bacterium]HRB19288.1 FGGY-family carbohydrate kinase [Chitinophagales bacterium]HRB92093.1 FGGY-family carbohydrate kinase [Chitinophagales bacterium]
MNYFLAYDVGTSSVKSILVDEKGTILASAIESYPLQMPHPGWVEQIPDDYWKAICSATKKLTQATTIDKNKIKGLAFTTQAMGIIPMSIEGKVLYNNISWVDGRAEKQARKAMRRMGGKAIFKTIVGVEITGKDVIPKLIWLKENEPKIYHQTHKFLDVNGYLKFKCTGKMVAEWSGACSYAFNLKKKDWERLFFKITGAGTEKLPDLVKSTDLVGTLTEQAAQDLDLPLQVQVFGGCDDTQSAALGTTAIGEGEAHIYVGTSAWVGVTTSKPLGFKNGLFCLQSADPKMNMVVGITESAGVNTEWLLDTFYAEEKKNLSETALFELLENEIKQTTAGADYLIVTPWFLGERCPVSTTTTRSTIFNLSHQHTRAHIARAHFEGIAYNLRWTIQNLEKDFGFKITELKITGGGTLNDTWMQNIADITQRKISSTSQPKNAGALGAAMCALVDSGTFKNFSDIYQFIQTHKTYIPTTENNKIYHQLFHNYQQIYHQLKKTYHQINKDRFEIQFNENEH